MWAANAATISPSADTLDGKLHITPANLTFQLHRSLEAPFTAKLLRTLFPGELFVHHDPLPPALTDEGAANHSRLSKNQNDPGIELFTFGKSSARFTPRQSPRASKAIARLHKLPPQKTFFLEQSPRAIDAGVFHNDVIAVAHRHIFLYHELAYENFPLAALQRKFRRLLPIRIPQNLLPLNDAVRSYLFNSQLVTLPDDTFALILPTECREINSAARTIDFIREKAPIISTAAFINVRQSMNNGGGPACLRLRVVLTPREEKAVHAGILFTDTLYKKLRTWIETHYRETLRPADLADPRLLRESRTALDELTRILKLPPLYPFQQ
jgi:succinylarginine dihydrolase